MNLAWRIGAGISLSALIILIWDTVDFLTVNKMPQTLGILGLLLGAAGIYLLSKNMGK